MRECFFERREKGAAKRFLAILSLEILRGKGNRVKKRVSIDFESKYRDVFTILSQNSSNSNKYETKFGIFPSKKTIKKDGIERDIRKETKMAVSEGEKGAAGRKPRNYTNFQILSGAVPRNGSREDPFGLRSVSRKIR